MTRLTPMIPVSDLQELIKVFVDLCNHYVELSREHPKILREMATSSIVYGEVVKNLNNLILEKAVDVPAQ